MQVSYSRMITKEIKESNFFTFSGEKTFCSWTCLDKDLCEVEQSIEGQNFLVSKNESNFSHPLLPRWAGICCWFSRQRYFTAFLEI